MTALKNVWFLLKETFLEWHQDNVILLAGALSFFTVFSIVPILILTIAITGMILGEQKAQEEIVRQTTLLFSPQAATAFKIFLNSASRSGAGMASIFSGALLVYVGSRVFHQLHNALGIIWKISNKKKSVVTTTIKGHLLSFAMMAGLGAFFLIFFLMDTTLQAAHAVVVDFIPQFRTLVPLKTTSYFISLTAFALFCAFVYRYVPRAGVRWKDVWLGAIVASVLFTGGRSLFTLYFRLGDFTSIYGAAASGIIFLIWIYFAANIFLFGAEFTWVYANRYGSRVKPT